MTKIDHAKIISDYQEAFKKFNGFCHYKIEYVNGRFKFDEMGSFTTAKMLDMTAVLNQRVRNKELDKCPT